MSAPGGAAVSVSAATPLRRLRRRWPGLFSAQRWRLASGLVLFLFALSHFLNHALGLVSLQAMEAAQDIRARFWNMPPMPLVLYGSFAVHIGLALIRLATRTGWRMPLWEAAQIGLGLLIPVWLIAHVVGTRVIGQFYGFDERYLNVLRLLWPDLALNQSVLLVMVWVHAVIGLHHWLKLKSWYGAAAPWLLGLSVLVPTLAIAGWIEGARLAAAIPPTHPLLNGDQLAAGTRYIEGGRLAYVAVCVALVAAILGRWAFARARASISIGFGNGRAVRARPGATLLEIARTHGIPHVAICGGRGRCTTCRVQVLDGASGLNPPEPLEMAALARIGAPPGVRLACQIRPRADLSVRALVPVRVSPSTAGSDPYRWGVERRITVMFADLRGFTTLSEKLYPYDAVFLLNRYFEVMAEVIRAHGGVVDKFLGDGIMALFGVDPQPGAGSRAAIFAARDMVTALERLNEELAATLPAPLRMGIGIHLGPAVLGRVGATAMDGRSALTALGDTVNIASRLESLNKDFGTMLVVSAAAVAASGLTLTGGATHEADVRGREASVQVLAFTDIGAMIGEAVSA